jgi:hypothetical protein
MATRKQVQAAKRNVTSAQQAARRDPRAAQGRLS